MVAISIVIPAYNAEESLERAVASAQAQTIQDFEIIIVDDASSDGTVALAQRLAAADRRIRVLRNEANSGPSITRNRGFAAASGEWIAILDSDDAYVPDRLERLMSLGRERNADIVADNLALYDWAAGKIVGDALSRPRPGEVRTVDTRHFLANCITGQSPFDYGQLKAMLRRDFVERHGLRYPDKLRHGEDFILYAEALLAGANFVLTGSSYYLFTQRVGSVSAESSRMSRTIANFDAMRAYTIALGNHPAVMRDPALAALLHRRAEAIVWHQSWVKVYPAVRARNLFGIMSAILRDWRVAPMLARAVYRRFVPAREA
ncbi:glycosyl transferase [Sphingomonas oleivorans]|uniref:Glycosyl transferase n=1 Tax=Sphingomonas oleivorans TaxID=1735121 RepID=A0A2T5FYX7_9SPHN|nr:glycosyltransferase family 2 protein [Sphingomonas oleivorans]PTQ11788.1 glycosyl transferase [Sphingomonas oleivorans]